MTGKSLLCTLTDVMVAQKKMNQVDTDDRIDQITADAMKTIRPEFQDEFTRFVEQLSMPSVEFVAYWENSEECRQAIKIVLEAMLAEIETGCRAVREIANWNPTS